MKLDGTDFYAALIHELRNTLGLLSMALESIPLQGEPAHDASVDSARLLCQGVVDRLQQGLLIYKANNRQLQPAIDAYSPHDLLREVEARAAALSRGRLRVETALRPEVPAIWFLDRDLIEMALINAVQNSLSHARSEIRLEAGIQEGYLALSVRDDSDGYPQQVLDSVAANAPYRAAGTGLGLQFSRLIAQSHENQGRSGELRLRNDPGAVFSLLLP